MGKATILQSLGAGHYKIKVEFENARAEARKLMIDQQIIEATAKLDEIAAKKQTALDKLNADLEALNIYIASVMVEEYVTNPEPINKLTETVYESKLAYDLLVSDERREKLKKTSLEKDKEYLIKYCPKEFEVNAWCVSFNEDLNGVIKTLEVDYILERDVITNQIRNDTGFWLPATQQTPDTILQHPPAGSVHSTWFNLAIYPALQKDKGRYRIATITSINKPANKCNLTFDGYYNISEFSNKLVDDKPVLPKFDFSGVQQINYTDATIEYMTCDANAFEVNDRVIVDLHGGVSVPTVIGFYENPRKCIGYKWVFTIPPSMGINQSLTASLDITYSVADASGCVGGNQRYMMDSHVDTREGVSTGAYFNNDTPVKTRPGNVTMPDIITVSLNTDRTVNSIRAYTPYINASSPRNHFMQLSEEKTYLHTTTINVTLFDGSIVVPDMVYSQTDSLVFDSATENHYLTTTITNFSVIKITVQDDLWFYECLTTTNATNGSATALQERVTTDRATGVVTRETLWQFSGPSGLNGGPFNWLTPPFILEDLRGSAGDDWHTDCLVTNPSSSTPSGSSSSFAIGILYT